MALSARVLRSLSASVVSRNIARFSSTPLKNKASKLDLGGIYPPIVTPFNVDESVAYDKLQFNLDKWENVNFKGYVVQGSNGEYVYLDPEERVEIVKQVKKRIQTGKLLIAGSGCESTRATIEMTKRMAGVGADAALVVTPCFYKSGMRPETMIKHFIQVADQSPIPVILYSVPGNTGIDLDPEVVIELASHSNIVALKDSGGNVSKLGYIVFKTKHLDFQVLAGSASFLLPSFVVGCVGGIVALANCLGDPLCQLYDLYRKGDMETAKQLQLRLIGPNMAVTQRLGIAGLKMSMEWFGYYGGVTRSPIQALSLPDIEILRKSFAESDFFNTA